MSSMETYSTPKQAKEVFWKGILENPLIGQRLPSETADYASKVTFEGSEKPSLPVNWRFAESISALKALEAVMINVLLGRKYGVKEPPRVKINTDHAQLFFMSALLPNIDPDGLQLKPGNDPGFEQVFPSWDKADAHVKPYRVAATNIYRTKDDRYFHLHGSMNPDPTIQSLGLPLHKEVSCQEEAWSPFMDKVGEKTAHEIDRLENEEHGQAGTICWTTEEYLQSAHGKANAHVGLYELNKIHQYTQPPCWWDSNAYTSAKRPLAGLKVVDMTRVIAAPAITRGLAELGASVMRVTCPRLPDYSVLHPDLNWGKWNTCLDFKNDTDRETMRQLILEADVVVQGYRPGVLDKFGLGEEGVLELCKNRERGVIVVRENCYGWNGPWAGRSGWQQISDACCGVSMEFGRAMGNNEPVTPVFPNSDYCTGIAGVVAVLDGLLRRANEGGSYLADVALNYYSQWLVNSCGTYPEEVWRELWERNNKPVFRHYHGMSITLPAFLEMMSRNHRETLLRSEFFEKRPCSSIGYSIKTVKPILQYEDGEVELKYNIGTRGNGVDKAYWPSDPMMEILK